MSTVFLYGTLRHLPLLEVVLGRRPNDADMLDVTLPDATVSWVEDQTFPMISLGVEGAAKGLLLRNLSDADIARLDYYEAPFGYALQDVTTSGGAAKTYLPGADVGRAAAPFVLEDWVADWGPMRVLAATEIMGYFGLRSPAEIARMSHSIALRASSRLRASQTQPSGFAGKLEITDRRMAYANFFAVEEVSFKAETFQGGMGPEIDRAAFMGFDVAIVLPYDPVRDRVLLVEQVRSGPIVRGDPRLWHLEPVAGLIDPGETPQEAAIREAWEEARLRLDRLETVAECYPSNGASAEFFYTYVGITDLPDDITTIAGVVDEGENIRTHLVSFDDLMVMLETQQAIDAPVVMTGYWLAHHRARLRAS